LHLITIFRLAVVAVGCSVRRTRTVRTQALFGFGEYLG
jgi:hypothetical protein